MDFILFLAVNAVLFLRPSELVPELRPYPIYYFAIVACLFFSVIRLIRFFMVDPVRRHPSVTLMFGMLGFAVISLTLNSDKPLDGISEMSKVMTYFVLFLSLVHTSGRLRAVTGVVAICLMTTSIVGILHFKDVISVQALEMKGELVQDPVTLDWHNLKRLRFTGMIQDPNEVAVLLTVMFFLCGYQWRHRAYGIFRHLWTLPMGIFLGAIGFTMSRGGLLALIVGTVVFAVYRYSSKRALVFSSFALVALFLLFAGRQTEISSSTTTGAGRIGLWSDWLDEFRQSPVIGVGPKFEAEEVVVAVDQAAEKHCAHNSYLQGYADLGFFGGACFLGAFLFAFGTLHQYGFGRTYILDPEAQRLLPYLMASLAAYMTGMMTLMLNYLTSTMFVLALPLAYWGMTPCYPSVRIGRLGVESLFRLALASVGYLAFIYVFVRLFRNY